MRTHIALMTAGENGEVEVTTRGSRIGTALLAASFLAIMVAAPVDARRGGSFGSRGSRTYSAPRSTRIAPGYTPGLSRSMTPYASSQSQYGSRARYGSGYSPGFGQRARPRFGFGSGLLAGVLAGGLFGSIFGHGAGGYAGAGAGGGLLALLIQVAIIGGIVWLVLRMVRGRRSAMATGPSPQFAQPMPFQSGGYGSQPFAGSPAQDSDISLTSDDQDAFEKLLIELQDAFGHEDYSRLRAITTPEIMSYLAEELSDNATHGRRNEVTGTRLLDAEVSEAWQEENAEYATIAMRYESVDVMRDRASGAVMSGDPTRPSQTAEIWTFTRPPGAWGGWKVSAIQEA